VVVQFAKFDWRRPKFGLDWRVYVPRQFSVLIVLYNKAHYLKRSLGSVLRLPIERTSMEIICVDDASSDNTSKIIARLQKNDDRIALYSLRENVGTHRARIFAVQVVQTPFLAFLDPDDEFVGAGVQEALQSIIENDGDIVEFGCNTIAPKKRYGYCWLRPRQTTASPAKFKEWYYEGKIHCHLHRRIFRTELYHEALLAMPEYLLKTRILRYEDKLHMAFIVEKMTRNFYYVKTLGEIRYAGLPDNSMSSSYQSVNASLANDQYVTWIINTTFGRIAK
jgi:glycosyltransferase involved in cell wall biosynthesis